MCKYDTNFMMTRNLSFNKKCADGQRTDDLEFDLPDLFLITNVYLRMQLPR